MPAPFFCEFNELRGRHADSEFEQVCRPQTRNSRSSDSKKEMRRPLILFDNLPPRDSISVRSYISRRRAWLVIRHEILWKRRVELLLLQPLGSVALQIGYERGYCRVFGISRRTEGLCWRAPELFSKIWGHQVGR